jgi:hypothetical protein
LLVLRSLSTRRTQCSWSYRLLREPEYREVDDCILHHADRHHQAKGGKHMHRRGGCVGVGLRRHWRHADNIGMGAGPRPAKSSSMCGARESRRRCCATSWGRRWGRNMMYMAKVIDMKGEKDWGVFWVIQKYVGVQMGLRVSTTYIMVYIRYIAKL